MGAETNKPLSATDGLKKLREKKHYNYKLVKDTTIPYKGKKIKFRVLVREMATQLTKYNTHSYKLNRLELLGAFYNGGVEEMNNFYKEELVKGMTDKIKKGKL